VKRLVKESLVEERWVSTDTGAERYANYQSITPELKDEDIKEMIPPTTIKLSPEEFNNYVENLIQMIPKSPMLAIYVFKEVMKEHPYLSKKPIGFKTTNPYEPIINKFLKKFKPLEH